MDHHEASSLLPDLVAGELDTDLQEALERHTDRCEECRVWVATASLLKESLVASGAPADLAEGNHLSSSELVSFALTPEALSSTARERCSRHVAACLACRTERELVASAVAEARSGEKRVPDSLSELGEPIPARTSSRRRLRPAYALALAAAILIVTCIWLFESRLSMAPAELVLAGQLLDGSQELMAERTILVAETEISSGATVALAAGQAVAFGNGFSVRSGARLSVSTTKDLSARFPNEADL